MSNVKFLLEWVRVVGYNWSGLFFFYQKLVIHCLYVIPDSPSTPLAFLMFTVSDEVTLSVA